MQLIEDHGVIGGAEQVALDLAAGVASSGVESYLGIVGNTVLGAEATARGIRWLPIASRGGISISSLSALRHAIRTNAIDLVHSHLLKMNSLNALLAITTNVSTVCSVHGLLDHELTGKARWFGRLAGQLTSKTVCVSEALRKQVIEAYRLRPERVSTIHNGFDPARLKPALPAQIEDLKQKIGLKDDEILLCAIGNIKPVKGYRYLIEAIAQLKTDHPHLRLVIAGAASDPEAALLAELIKAHGLGAHVTLLGTYRTIAALMAISRIYLCSSLAEGFSLTTAEAMAFGLPVVVTDSGGPSEIVGSGEHGVIVAPASGTELASGIKRILDRPAEAREIATRGQQRAVAEFTLQRMIENHRELYRSLLAAR